MFSEQEKAQIDAQYRQLSQSADLLYQFVMLYNDYIHTSRDYGTGEFISMVEVHTLTMIEEAPGITVSQLAQKWGRTKGAVSQNVTKLENKGLIYRERSQANGKNVLLYPTEKGIVLSTAHKSYDNRDILETRKALGETCTEAEIDTFFKVLASYTGLFLP